MTVVVVYGLGSASPRDIAAAAAEVGCDLVFLTDTRVPHCREIEPILRFLGTVIDVADGLDECVRALAARRPRGIVTFSESRLMLTARLAQRLGLAYHSVETARRLTDKTRQRHVLNQDNVSPTRSVRAADARDLRRAAEAVGCPVVIKPARGEGSRWTMRCASDDDLDALIDMIAGSGPLAGESWAVEEELPSAPHPAGDFLGDYVSVESAVQGDRIWHFCVSDKLPLAPPFRERGTVLPSHLPADLRASVLDLAGRTIRSIGVTTGITHVEVKLTPAGPRVIEINGRLAGSAGRLLRRCSSLDPVRLAMELSLGRDLAGRDIGFTGRAMKYLVLPPPGRWRLSGAPDALGFTTIPAVWSVESSAAPGDVLDSRCGTLDAIAAVYADIADGTGARELIAHLDEVAKACARLETASP